MHANSSRYNIKMRIFTKIRFITGLLYCIRLYRCFYFSGHGQYNLSHIYAVPQRHPENLITLNRSIWDTECSIFPVSPFSYYPLYLIRLPLPILLSLLQPLSSCLTPPLLYSSTLFFECGLVFTMSQYSEWIHFSHCVDHFFLPSCLPSFLPLASHSRGKLNSTLLHNELFYFGYLSVFCCSYLLIFTNVNL